MKVMLVWLLISVGSDGATTLAQFRNPEDCERVVIDLVSSVSHDGISFKRYPKCIMARVAVGG